MIGIVITIISMIIQNYIINYINEYFVKPKMSRHIIVTIYTVVIMLYTYISANLELKVIYKFFIPFIIQFILVLTLYYGSIKLKAMAFIEFQIIEIILDIAVAQIITGLLEQHVSMAKSYSIESAIFILVCTFLQIPIVCIIIKSHKILKYNFSKKQFKMIIAFFVNYIVVVSLCDMILYRGNIYIGNLFFSFILCSIVFCVYIFKIMVLIEVKNETEESIVNMSKQNKMVMEYYEDISYKISNLSELRETYESKLKEVYKQAGKEYEYKVNADEYKHIQCENTVVDNIITNVCIDLDRMKCEYDIAMNIPDNIKMETMDLASIFINLFDNALSAIEEYVGEYGSGMPSNGMPSRTEKYYLMAYADYGDDGLTIEVKNIKSKSAKVRRMNDIFITTKENKEAHGYGMQIIKRIAKKYNGTMEVEYDETSFVNRVTLKC